MPESSFQLDHLNLPARDPEGLARWYAGAFGLRAEKHLVRGPGVLIAFQAGEPLNRAPDFHIGMRVPSMRVLSEWAEKFNATIKAGPEFSSFRTADPEGNCVELYTPSSAT
jgi:catechol 2,3-dioxygenase-like lactoylglutathione lyase family enzyme